jgi:SdrD B-like domain
MNPRFQFGIFLVVSLLIVLPISHIAQSAPLAQLNVIPTPTPGPDGRIMYTARENDNIYIISAIAGISADEFRKLNPFIKDDIIITGQKYLIGYGGPSVAAPTSGQLPTQPAFTPSPTAPPGWGVLCVLLYNDSNGDSMREESEPSISGGEISVSNRLGTVSLTGKTPSGGIATNIVNPTPQERGYFCFDQLLQGEYLISVAAPEGYNRTTTLNTTVNLEAGQTTQIAFGAQANSELQAESAIIPESPRKSPIMGIVGGMLLLGGLGLGIYATLLRRASGTKTG